jgi:DNA-binding NarL/FixJ family response regulator
MTRRKVQVVTADDHSLVREGLRLLISAPGGLEVVG